jgi:hypothetical protein
VRGVSIAFDGVEGVADNRDHDAGVAFAFAQVEDEDTTGLNKQRVEKSFSHHNPVAFGFPPVVHAASLPDQGIYPVERHTGLLETPVNEGGAPEVTGTEVDALQIFINPGTAVDAG